MFCNIKEGVCVVGIMVGIIRVGFGAVLNINVGVEAAVPYTALLGTVLGALLWALYCPPTPGMLIICWGAPYTPLVLPIVLPSDDSTPRLALIIGVVVPSYRRIVVPCVCEAWNRCGDKPKPVKGCCVI